MLKAIHVSDYLQSAHEKAVSVEAQIRCNRLNPNISRVCWFSWNVRVKQVAKN